MPDINKDPNYLSYKSSLKSKEWYSRFKGKYVAFVEGKFVDNDSDKNTLLERVRKIFKEKSYFVTEVDRRSEVIDLPTPFLD